MKWCECKQYIKADYKQLCGPTKRSRLQFVRGACMKLITNASFKVTFWFRIGSYLQARQCILFKPLYWLVSWIYMHYKFKTGIQMPLGTQIGPGLVFPHFGCQVIHEDSIIGENAHIFQRVTIGGMKGEGVPRIGNNVVIFGGSSIIGNVTIGDNAVVGAGAVVIKDVPAGSVVAGVPARVVSQRGEEIVKQYIYF